MNMLHDIQGEADAADDLSTLAWVHDELRRSLELAHKSLRRYLKEAEGGSGSDVAAVDPSVLRSARAQLHQGVGALEMIGLPGPTRVLRASESAVQRFIAKPKMLNRAAVEAIESASFGVLDYLGRKLAGKGVPTLALFPQYRALQEWAGADRVHPADLWRDDWRWLELGSDAAATPRGADMAARNEMETLVLATLRGDNRDALKRLSELCAGLGAASEERLAGLWKLAAAFYEAQAAGLLQADVYAKRVSSRLLAQLRLSLAGHTEVSDRLAQDVLFFCAHARAPADAQAAPRLQAVRAAYQLDSAAAFDYQALRLGRFDPAWIAQARKRVAGAKEVWSAVAAGETHRLAGLGEAFTLVGDSLRRLYPSGETLADALLAAAARTQAEGQTPAPALAMEAATSLLYLDASLEDGEFDHPLVAARVQRLAQRIGHVAEGHGAQPLEPWMEELYRRVSDRQTMGSVVQELRASLADVEKQIDQYFRNPAQSEVLVPVPAQLQAMRSVLSVLDLEQASQAVLRMRDDVDALVAAGADPQHAARAGAFEHLADNLGALSFMIDMLSVQPHTARSLFRFDPASGSLAAVMGRRAQQPSSLGGLDGLEPGAPQPLVHQVQSLALAAAAPELADDDLQQELKRLSQQALLADRRALADTMVSAQAALERAADDAERQAVRAGLAQAVAELAEPTHRDEAVQQPARATPDPLPEVQGSTGLEDDAEMREIFIEEAREVLQGAQEALVRLGRRPDDLGDLTLIRRAFHTLKGSSRMVGLKDFGEAAWSCEQLYNARLAESSRLDDELGEFTGAALHELGHGVEAVAGSGTGSFDAAALSARADALRQRAPVAATTSAAAATAALLERVPQLPSAQDLQLDFGLPHGAPAASAAPAALFDPLPGAEPAAAAPVPAHEAAFEFDLGSGLLHELPGADGPAPAAPADSAAPVARPAPPPEAWTGADPSGGFMLDFGPTDHAGLASFVPEPGLDRPPAEPVAEAPSAATGDAEFDAVFGEPPAAPSADVSAELAAEPMDPAWSEAGAPMALRAHQLPAEPAPNQVEAVAIDAAGAQAPAAPADTAAQDDQVKIIGDLRIGIPLFNIYLNEADEWSRRLCTDLSEWALESSTRPVDESTAALAHSLAGSSATVGYAELSALARSLEHALMRSIAVGRATPGEPQLFVDVAEEIRRLLHQFAAGFLKSVPAPLLERLAQHELDPASAATANATPGRPEPAGADGEADELPQDLALQRVDAEVQDDAAVAAEPLDAGLAAESTAAPVMPAMPVAPAADAADTADTADRAPLAPLPSVSDVLGQAALAPFADLAPPSAPAIPRPHRDALDDEDDIDAVDQLDDELLEIFREEGEELLPQLQSRVREWSRRPAEPGAAAACMRTLHTFKGGARLAGAMRLGEMAHRLETAIEHLLARGQVGSADVEALLARVDAITGGFEVLGRRVDEAEPAPGAAPRSGPALMLTGTTGLDGEAPPRPEPASPPPVPTVSPGSAARRKAAEPRAAGAIEWSRFSAGAAPPQPLADKPAASAAAVRVRAPLLDRLVNHAGEVSITRARIETDVGQIKGSLSDLTENLERLRRQLRDLELQAESQIASRMEAAKAASQQFDPLEMDRFTRFQELTRMMAESVNDVATVQRGLQRSLQATEDELAAQARLTRDLQDDLLRTRMVEFESLADRLYRVVRQAAKDSGKQVRLDIVGGSIEIDRGVLERMTGPFEHLLRNGVAHGIESPAARAAAGKDATGSITIGLAQEGNEVSIEFRDDGVGLDLGRIRSRAVQLGLLAPDAEPADGELANLIFSPGFSTAETVSELAGRGIGMDVVRAEVNAMGGRIETASSAGQGTVFRLVLPLTTAVTQVVMLRCGTSSVAVPSTLVELVKRVGSDEIEQAYASGSITLGERSLPFFWLGALLQSGARGEASRRSQPLVVIRSAAQRVVLHVDEVLGNQEVVVKNLGPQLARLPGLAGITLLPSGAVALIYNPVALATLYGDAAREQARRHAGVAEPETPVAAAEARAPLVLVVDDSLTVRRVTQRLLVREGYRVTLAKDGLDALDKLGDELPAVVLSDIEMPRMDGFDLVRNLRSDARLAALPVIMITSRIAQKHRDYAASLGVNHYLGKPYSEEELLSLVGRYVQQAVAH